MDDLRRIWEKPVLETAAEMDGKKRLANIVTGENDDWQKWQECQLLRMASAENGDWWKWQLVKIASGKNGDLR